MFCTGPHLNEQLHLLRIVDFHEVCQGLAIISSTPVSQGPEGIREREDGGKPTTTRYPEVSVGSVVLTRIGERPGRRSVRPAAGICWTVTCIFGSQCSPLPAEKPHPLFTLQLFHLRVCLRGLSTVRGSRHWVSVQLCRTLPVSPLTSD